MKNLDILILTSVVVICFLTFFVSTFRAFESSAEKKEVYSNKRGIISRFLAYLESLTAD